MTIYCVILTRYSNNPFLTSSTRFRVWCRTIVYMRQVHYVITIYHQHKNICTRWRHVHNNNVSAIVGTNSVTESVQSCIAHTLLPMNVKQGPKTLSTRAQNDSRTKRASQSAHYLSQGKLSPPQSLLHFRPFSYPCMQIVQV